MPGAEEMRYCVDGGVSTHFLLTAELTDTLATTVPCGAITRAESEQPPVTGSGIFIGLRTPTNCHHHPWASSWCQGHMWPGILWVLEFMDRTHHHLPTHPTRLCTRSPPLCHVQETQKISLAKSHGDQWFRMIDSQLKAGRRRRLVFSSNYQ